MQRIIFGLVTIIGVGSMLTFGMTGAFFGDTERSIGNTFAAGAIDLLVDNESYYNGVISEATTWLDPENLGEGLLFFDFHDLKPDDEGEDTISLHVQNDAWACMDLTLTSDDDISSNEPELATGDPEDVVEDIWDGELGGLIQMVWWADDGDNVLEEGENILVNGGEPLPITTLFGDDKLFSVALADSENNAWGNVGQPLAADAVHYVAKGWCFGTMTLDPLEQDGSGELRSPIGPDGSGFICDGSTLGNESQTDGLTLDVQFSAIQSRHNPSFLCAGGTPCEFDPDLNLVVNGGFETPEVTASEQWDIFDSIAGGWTVEWREDIPASFNPPGPVPSQPRPDPAHLELHEGVLGASFEGDQYAELDSDWGGHGDPQYTGEPASITVYQDIVTIPGAEYTLKYHWAARPNTVAGNNRLEVEWDGSVVDDTGTLADPNDGITWIERTVNLTATGALTRLQFIDRGTADSLGTFLDNVRLYQTSCPNAENGGGGGQEVPTLPTLLLSEDFGSGSTSGTFPPPWEKHEGETVMRNPSANGENSASPNGGRFALIREDSNDGGSVDGWICRSIDATSYSSLMLSYYWRGDADAESGGGGEDDGLVQAKLASGNDCSDTSGWDELQNHNLSVDSSWTLQSPFSLGAFDGTEFLLRFYNDSTADDEYFRVDGVELSGIPN